MIRLRDMKEDEGPPPEATANVRPATTPSGRNRKPRGVPVPPSPATDMTFYNPAQVAEMWGISHDKVLEFIKTGELNAFNVASKNSRRPQFKISGAALTAFQERRSGRDPARSLPPPAPRRSSRKPSSRQARTYF